VCAGFWWENLKERDGNHEGKRPLRRIRHRWEDNIKVDLQEV
jgi:hypothetical protein